MQNFEEDLEYIKNKYETLLIEHEKTRQEKQIMQYGHNTYNAILDVIGTDEEANNKWQELLQLINIKQTNVSHFKTAMNQMSNSKIDKPLEPMSMMERSMLSKQSEIILELRKELAIYIELKHYLKFIELLKESETLKQEWDRFMTIAKLSM